MRCPVLRQTFSHIPGIGAATEARLWAQGIDDWEKATADALRLGQRKRQAFSEHLHHSQTAYAEGNARFFADRLAPSQHWRLFEAFRGRTAYLDIETTGLMTPTDHITTIALYDGRHVHHYVHGQNLDHFTRDIARYDLLVTYNGKCFDVPCIEACLGCRLPQAHLDLRYVLKSLGYGGGLKRCEQTLGLARPGLEDVDGYMAVMLWTEYRRRGDPRALETLLAYNVEDVLTLERLAVLAYNRKLNETPFANDRQLPEAEPPPNPFHPHQDVLAHIRHTHPPHALNPLNH